QVEHAFGECQRFIVKGRAIDHGCTPGENLIVPPSCTQVTLHELNHGRRQPGSNRNFCFNEDSDQQREEVPMELPNKELGDLFDQLGLSSTPEDIEAFFASHSLPPEIKLIDAPFWTPAQARFLKEE